MARIIILTGNYGSGKTELALYLAGQLAETGKKTTLVDLDIVNPYFRSSSRRRELEARGIRVLAPNFAGTNLDVPSLPGEILSVFEDQTMQVIFDVGGEAAGAAALGRYHLLFEREGYELVFVVNARRPFTENAAEIDALIRKIEPKSQLTVTALAANTNLAFETDVSDVLYGLAVTEQAAKLRGIGVKWLCGMPAVLQMLPETVRKAYAGRMLAISPQMRPDWLDEV